LHGGPGGSISPSNRRFFDPKKYRVLLFDQRGCGKSTPFSSLEHNTTWDLVDDIEKLRQHMEAVLNTKIDKWVVFGGSWGSALALAYAEKYPERVKALLLRGIFCLRRKELLWFYQEGASFIFPEFWDKYLEPIPEAERSDMMAAYYKRLTGDNIEVRKNCGKVWTTWELSTSRLFVDENHIAEAAKDEFADAFARIECHYFMNAGFFHTDGQLIEDAHKISNIPGVIVQGRYDVVCPATTAWDLKKKWPKADLFIIPDAGHAAKEEGITSELIKAADKFSTYDIKL
jgi:proline iminopeptidase